jgi:hypothetical protein
MNKHWQNSSTDGTITSNSLMYGLLPITEVIFPPSSMANKPDESLAIGSVTEHDVERIRKETNRPDTELIRKQIEFLKLFDPDFKPKKEA